METGIGDIDTAALPPQRVAALCDEVTIGLDTADVEVYGPKKRGDGLQLPGTTLRAPARGQLGADRDGAGRGPDGR